MDESQREAYRQFCALIGTISDAGIRMDGDADYGHAVTEALTQAGAGYGRGYIREGA